MLMGPGKYDHLATIVREASEARGVVLAVLDGNLGSGFSVQGDRALMTWLPALLRSMADSLEKDGPPQPDEDPAHG